jgi:hypothetical protein
MAGAAAFTLYTGIAIILLYLMQYTGEKLDAVFVRVAAALFLAAGFIGGSGVVGHWMRSIFVGADTHGDELARTVVGSTVMYLVWTGLAVGWLLCLAPERWFSKAIPDWLSVGGLLIPSGAATIPGPAGHALVGALRGISTFVATPVTALFGG